MGNRRSNDAGDDDAGDYGADPRRERAIELRLAGSTLGEIKAELGVGWRRLDRWLAGVPKPASVHRTHHKDEWRAIAVELRRQGKSYREIRQTVPVSKSSLSLWLCDVPLTAEQEVRLDELQVANQQSRAEANRARRIRKTEVLQRTAAAEIGELSDRELFLLGVVAYWCEGSKEKPWNSNGRVRFINSDPSLVLLFVAWLRQIGIGDDDLILRLSIHESADVEAASLHWRRILPSIPEHQWRRPSLKRHRPNTVRKNIEDTYFGCVTIEVRRSTDLNRRIAGWWQGIARERAVVPDKVG